MLLTDFKKKLFELTFYFFDIFLPCSITISVTTQGLMNGFFQVYGQVYDELSIPIPLPETLIFFIMRLYKIGQESYFAKIIFLRTSKISQLPS